MTKTIEDKELGVIVFSKNTRAKRLIIRLKADCIAVTVPYHSTYDEAMKFVQSKREWIIANREKTQKKQQLISNTEPLKTLTFGVQLTPAERKDYLISLKNNILTIHYPQHISPESENAQEIFHRAVENALRYEAKRILPPMLKNLAAQYGFQYDNVKISAGKTRWGSCSSRKTINLSYFLLTLPEHLIRYVLLHELCHTREMNHGTHFWQLLDSVTDKRAKALAGEIKKYRTSF